MKNRTGLFLALAGSLLAASPAWSQVDPQGPESFDPIGTGYEYLPPIIFPGDDVVIKDLELVPTSPTVLPAPGSGLDFPAHSFFDVFADVSIGGGPFEPMTGGTATTTEGINPPANSSPTETFDTQISSLDLTGSVGGHSLDLHLDPNPPSQDTGETTITDNGGGHYTISSFFDIFTDLSLDGGTFAPQSGSPVQLNIVAAPDAGSTFLLLPFPMALFAWMRRRVIK